MARSATSATSATATTVSASAARGLTKEGVAATWPTDTWPLEKSPRVTPKVTPTSEIVLRLDAVDVSPPPRDDAWRNGSHGKEISPLLVSRLQLTLRRGERLLIVGPSGAGGRYIRYSLVAVTAGYQSHDHRTGCQSYGRYSLLRAALSIGHHAAHTATRIPRPTYGVPRPDIPRPA